MINMIQAIVMGLLQGITELFPISSLGHSVILPKLFGWGLDQQAPAFLNFLIATHLATALVLFFFFLRDWIEIAKGLGRSIRDRKIAPSDTYAKLGWLLVVGTVPAGIIGLVLEKPIRNLFGSPLIAAAFLVVNGLVLFGAERLRSRERQLTSARHVNTTATASDEEIATLSWKRAFGIGTAQAAALIPGISRSGSSMAGGLLSGLNNENAARFSFLLATPIIGAAAVLKLPELFTPDMADERGVFLVGALCAGVAAWFATKFLLRFFETRTLTPFAIYSVVGGVVYFVLMLVMG
ncbi:undecaprenyl-diphosphate phosphatase [Arthrobacter bambusae]|uniref:undecaprenyl-diphosphate phosphatase n=1 Tax=Arthrobacter bambusae TaxID=1338426 RepID=UPI0027895B50|nr:undecaprenyl-diphosphate phosphatase [Arthrobacter bambusae]MDQ0030831.1 undecaprenyl-diphosphatase [Arthrobacter bambusae]MDQ0099196.1 undecaprenyl-diphosphatase [Arthrobacter bambusae]